MKISASEAAVKSLEIEGVEYAFGILGSYILDLFDVVGRSKQIQYLGSRHEEHAAHMANGYARASNKVAITLAQVGAGVANQFHGLTMAYRANAPVIALGGGLTRAEIDTNDRHEFDQLAAMRPVTKWSARVASGERFPEYIQRAFRIARTPPYGPVFLEVPGDILTETFDWEPPNDPTRYRAKYQGMVDAAAIHEVCERLGRAQRPIFVVGPGGESEQAWADLAAISNGHGIAMTNTFAHNGAVPDSDLAVGSISRQGSRAAMRLLSEADLVVIIGSELAPSTTRPVYGFPYWPEQAEIVHVHPDALQIGRYKPIDCGIVAESENFLGALRAALEAAQPQDRSEWSAQIRSAKSEWLEQRATELLPAISDDGRYFNPAAVYWETRQCIGGEAIYVMDVGWTTSWGFKMFDAGHPKTMIYAGPLAGLGFSLPGAIGAKLGQPDRPVVTMMGDGAFSMSLPSLLSAVEHEIPLRIIVCDNQAWGAEKSHQIHWFERNLMGANLVNEDIAQIACGMGAKGVRVNTIEELRKELRDEPTRGPKVIVCPVHPEDLGKHPIRKPTRYLYT